VLTIGVLAASGCSAKVQKLEHSPSMAAAVAQEYVRLLMVEGDFSTAYELLDADARGRISLGKHSVIP